MKRTPFNLGLRIIDIARIDDIRRRCPDLDTTTAVLREALRVLDEKTGQEDQERRQARKASKEATK